MNDPVKALTKYLERREESQAEFSRRAKLNPSVICKALRRQRRPGLSAASRIEEATGDLIPASSWAKTFKFTRTPRRKVRRRRGA